MPEKSEKFDPFYTWLGIPKEEQPPDYYRLLGIQRFETNRDVISNAFDQRMAYIKTMQTGVHSADSQVILNELSLASRHLLNAQRKAEYDARLREKTGPVSVATRVKPAVTGRKRSQSPPKLLASIAVAVVLLATVLIVAFQGRSKPEPAPVTQSNRPKPQRPVSPKPPIKPVDSPIAPPVTPAAELEKPAPPATVGTPPPKPPAIADVSQPQGLQFSAGDHVEIADSQGLVDLKQPFTVEMWVKLAADQPSYWLAGDLVFQEPAAGTTKRIPAGWQLWLERAAGKVRIAAGTGQIIMSEVPLADSPWHHVGLCGDGKNLVLCIDGQITGQTSQEAFVAKWTPSPLNLHLGGHRQLHPKQPQAFQGEWRSFRVSKVNRYTGPYTPKRLELDDHTVALVDFSTGAEPIELAKHRSLHVIGAKFAQAAPKPAAVVAPAATEPARPAAVEPAKTALPSRWPAPADAALKTARERVLKLFRDDRTKATTAVEQAALAKRFCDLARETSEQPDSKFVLYLEAHALLVQANRGADSLTVLREVEQQFDVEMSTQRMDALERLSSAAKTPEERKDLVPVALAVADECVTAGKFTLADEAIRAANTLATKAKDADSRNTVREFQDQFRQLNKQRASLADLAELLKINPDNAEAHAALGKFLCLEQRAWDQGLPHLAAGNDEVLREAARLDLAGPGEPAAQVDVADRWWNLSEKAAGREQVSLWLRAESWYRQAGFLATGLTKVQCDKRLQQLERKLPAHLAMRTATGRPADVGPRAVVPPELVGLIGRITVDGRDVATVVRYEAGFTLNSARITDALSQMGLPPGGRVRIELVGLLHAPQKTTLHIKHRGGSATGSHSLLLDGKKLGDVGGERRPTDDTYKVDVAAGEHTLRWSLSGGDLGTSQLAITDGATGKNVPLYHSVPLGLQVRSTPTRVNLNMLK